MKKKMVISVSMAAALTLAVTALPWLFFSQPSIEEGRGAIAVAPSVVQGLEEIHKECEKNGALVRAASSRFLDTEDFGVPQEITFIEEKKIAYEELENIDLESSAWDEEEVEEESEEVNFANAPQAEVEDDDDHLPEFYVSLEKGKGEVASADYGSLNKAPKVEMVKVGSDYLLYGSEQKVYKQEQLKSDYNKKGTLLPTANEPLVLAEAKAYFISKKEVSNGEYALFVEATGHAAPTHWPKGRLPEAIKDLPVVNVSHDDARAFAKWVGKRLPTEEEWLRAHDLGVIDEDSTVTEWVLAVPADPKRYDATTSFRLAN